MTTRILNNQADLEMWFRFLRGKKLPQTVSTVDGRDRSYSQNRTQFMWAREAAEQRGDCTPEEVRCEWKLLYGVPIMRAECEAFRELYDAAIKPLPYELKLKAMRIVSVTSDMNIGQMTRYLDTIQRECGEQGIRLTDPNPMERAA